MFIQPKPITSPSGATSHPRLVERKVGQDLYTEAHYYCPVSGIFFHKGIVSIKKPDGTVEKG